MVVPDALATRVPSNSLVTGIRTCWLFMPVLRCARREGYALGHLCVIDRRCRRELWLTDSKHLKALSRCGNELELRRSVVRSFQSVRDARIVEDDSGGGRGGGGGVFFLVGGGGGCYFFFLGGVLDQLFQYFVRLFCIAGFDGYFKRLNIGGADRWEFPGRSFFRGRYVEVHSKNPDDRESHAKEAQKIRQRRGYVFIREPPSAAG